MRDTSSALPLVGATRQEPFGRVVLVMKAALLLGVGGGILLLVMALVLTDALPFTSNMWWTALIQAHGHLQLYGWGGLFVVAIILYFLACQRGAPLVAPWLIPWIVSIQVAALLMRLVSQPLLVVDESPFWRIVLVVSAVLECVAFASISLLFAFMIWRSPLAATRKVLKRVLPFLGGAFVALVLASVVNLGNVLQAALGTGLVQGQGDNLNVTLGLLGFLVPVALAIGVQSLSLYAGLERFPPQVLWSLSAFYFIGLALTFIGLSWTSAFPWLNIMSGLGMILLAIVLLACSAIFLYLLHQSGRLSWHGMRQGQSPADSTHPSQALSASEFKVYGPFVLLIASSYLWAMLGALLLICNGMILLLGIAPFVSFDAMRYCMAYGFIALFLAGVSVRMLPSFAGRALAGSAWVSALFWIGNATALLRIAPMLLLPVLVAWGDVGVTLYTLLVSLSGLVGLAFLLCLTITLWPALHGA
jgi:uncharacterized protein involved in response to NO